jgi:hypothetical protein
MKLSEDCETMLKEAQLLGFSVIRGRDGLLRVCTPDNRHRFVRASFYMERDITRKALRDFVRRWS